jgi:hypothetical protein
MRGSPAWAWSGSRGRTDNAAVLRLLRLRGAEGVTPLLALQEVGCFG